MSVIIINEENKEYVRNQLSIQRFLLVGENGVLTVGSVNEAGAITGVLQCELAAGGRVDLTWIFVAEECRHQKVASILLANICQVLRQTEYWQMNVVVPEGEASAEIRAFLVKQGFDFSSVTDDLAVIELEELSKRLKGLDNTRKLILPLASIPEKYAKQYMSEVAMDMYREQGWQAFDSNSCCGIVEKGNLVGMALTCQRENLDGVALVTLEACDAETMYTLLKYATEAAKRKYPNGGKMTIATLNGFGKKLRALFRKIAPPIGITAGWRQC